MPILSYFFTSFVLFFITMFPKETHSCLPYQNNNSRGALDLSILFCICLEIICIYFVFKSLWSLWIIEISWRNCHRIFTAEDSSWVKYKYVPHLLNTKGVVFPSVKIEEQNFSYNFVIVLKPKSVNLKISYVQLLNVTPWVMH